MALPVLEQDISYISKLADQPNDSTGSNLSAAELKARFDAAGEDIKAYLNSVLLPALEAAIAAAAEGVAGDAQIGSDKISDNAITASKLAASAVVTNAIANLAVATNKLADKAVTEAKIAEKSVSVNKIADAAVTKEKIAEGAVGATQMSNSAVATEKLKDAAVTTSKMADLSVTPGKLDRAYATLDEDSKVTASLTSSKVKIISNVTAYTLTAEDMGKMLIFEMSSGTTTVTIPTDADLSLFPVGSEVEISKWNGGLTLNIVTEGADADVLNIRTKDTNENTSITIGEKYGVIALKRLSTPKWYAVGDIE